MARAVTLKQLKTGLRFRLNETEGTTFTERTYPESAEGEAVDELKLAINDAQLFAARDIYDPDNYPFGRGGHELPVRDGARTYTLPEDCVEVMEIYHVKGSFRQQLHKQHIKDVDRGYEGHRGDSYYRYYDTNGLQEAVYVAIGTTSEAHATRIIDRHGDFSEVRFGDIVYNLTDGSEGTVTSFSSGYIQTDLFGGRVNQWRVGDNYGVATPEQTRKVLEVYPWITVGDSEVYSGSSNDITVTSSEIIDQVRVRFDTLPSDYESDERLTFSFYDADNLQSLNSLLDSEAIAGESMVRVGWNTIPFRRFQVHQNIVFNLLVTREDGTVVPVAEVQLSRTPTSNRLMLKYAKRPRLLVNDSSLCEFPTELISLIYARAKIILMEKLEGGGQQQSLARFYQEYEGELEKAKEYLWKLDEPGSFEVVVDQSGNYVDRVNGQNTEWALPNY